MEHTKIIRTTEGRQIYYIPERVIEHRDKWGIYNRTQKLERHRGETHTIFGPPETRGYHKLIEAQQSINATNEGDKSEEPKKEHIYKISKGDKVIEHTKTPGGRYTGIDTRGRTMNKGRINNPRGGGEQNIKGALPLIGEKETIHRV